MLEPITSYISSAWLKPLWTQLQKIRGERQKEIERIQNEFCDPLELARYYVEPDCQHHNPADRWEDEEPRSQVKSPVFKTINDFLTGEFAVTRTGKNQMFILSDAGMGKSSLLVMLRLSHLTRLWPQRHLCELLKLGPDTLERVKAIPAAGETVLLLDALDEDPTARGDLEARLKDLMDATAPFRQVLISCRTQFFPETSADPFSNPGRVQVAGFICPMIFLSLFDDRQVGEYLEKRYPDKWDRWFRANNKRESARQMVQQMRDLRCRPMLLAHIEDLMNSTVTQWDEYHVFKALIAAWLGREEGKFIKQGRKDITSETLRRACIHAAGAMQRKGTRWLTEEELDELVKTHQEIAQLRQLDFSGRCLLNRTALGSYRFSHYSIQEFFLAQRLLFESTNAEGIVFPSTASENTLKFLLAARAKECPDMKLILRGANLARFDLRGRVLRAVDLSDADLTNANLSNANLTDANLTNAILTNANLTNTTLTIANLTNVCLMGARLDKVVLTGANLTGVILPQPVEERPFSIVLGTEIMLEMVWIPSGSFHRGDKLEFEVRLTRGFWLGKYPTTQRQFSALTGNNPSHFKTDPNAPVETLNWDEAVAWCRRLNERLADAEWHSRFEFRLPTEAEWEFACRAGTTTRFHFGDDETELSDYAWFDKNSGGHTHPVGGKKPNPWELYDMHGNVWEWCQDWFAEDYYRRAPKDNPPGPENGEDRVLRGGCWDDPGGYCRSAYRDYDCPSRRGRGIGFRVVLAPRSVS